VLEIFLVSVGLYESEEESALREEVISQIDQIVKQWVKQLTREKGYTEQMVEESNAKVFTFGSYRLRVSVILLEISDVILSSAIFRLAFRLFPLYSLGLNLCGSP
jgi:poly(A) polymerase Pap1